MSNPRPERCQPIASTATAILAALATAPARAVAERYGVSPTTVHRMVYRARAAGIAVQRYRMPSPDRRPWTEGDDAHLVAMRNGGMCDSDIVSITGRSMPAILTRLCRLRMGGAAVACTRRWSDEHSDTLVAMYDAGATADEIARSIGRDRRGVARRIRWFQADGVLEARARRRAAGALDGTRSPA